MSGAKTLLLLAAVPLLMGAEVYRWVDANGVVNSSQMKPRGVAAEQIATDPGAPPATPEAAPAPASSELSTEQRRVRRDLQQQERTRQQDVAEIRAANCAHAQRTLEQLTVRSRVNLTEEDGTVRTLSEQERQARIKEAQDAVVEHCVS